MLVLLSPAKKQDFEQPAPDFESTKPQAARYTAELVDVLKKLKKNDIGKLMHVSDKIAELNYHRFQQFDPKKYHHGNAKQAVFAFQGDAYKSLDPLSLKSKSIEFMQDHLLILSGLYGYLRPLDLIQPYRLEMKTLLKNPKGKDLYEFWGDKISKAILKAVKNHKNKTIINLASNEYFNAVDMDELDEQVLTIQFKEQSGATYKTIGLHAKRARGAMTRYIMENRINMPDDLKDFDVDGYNYTEELSGDTTWVFVR